MMRRSVMAIVLAVVGAAGVVVAQAQSTPPPVNPPVQGPPRGGRAGQRNPGAPQVPPAANVNQAEIQVQELLNLAALRRAKVFLALSDTQFPLFFDKMTELQNVRDRHQQQRRRMINQLRRLTSPDAPAADDATLTMRAKDLDDSEAQGAEQERQALAALDVVLTPFQRARFRVFEEEMERQKITMLAAAMAKK